MEWRDEGLILGGRRFGESGLILDVLTRGRGRRSGLVYGGASRKRRAQYEPGNSLVLSWSGRLEDQLGRFDVAEAVSARAARYLDLPDPLAAIGAVTAILRGSLDKGDEAGSALYEASVLLLDSLDEPEVWPVLYARWELGLLAALGFGLDIERCAISGEQDGLTHVSPRTGRAVRASEAEDYLDRLFVLPAFFLDPLAPAGPRDVGAGLTLTGHFLEQRLFAAHNRPLPEARAVLLRRLVRSGLAEFA